MNTSTTTTSPSLDFIHVNMKNRYGSHSNHEALLDSGAEGSLITENLVHQLGLTTYPAQILLKGFSGHSSRTSKGTLLEMSIPAINNQDFPHILVEHPAWVVPKLSHSADLLLGKPFLRENGVITNHRNGEIHFSMGATNTLVKVKGALPQSLGHQDKGTTVALVRVSAAVILPPNQGQVFTCKNIYLEWEAPSFCLPATNNTLVVKLIG